VALNRLAGVKGGIWFLGMTAKLWKITKGKS